MSDNYEERAGKYKNELLELAKNAFEGAKDHVPPEATPGLEKAYQNIVKSIDQLARLQLKRDQAFDKINKGIKELRAVIVQDEKN